MAKTTWKQLTPTDRVRVVISVLSIAYLIYFMYGVFGR